MKTVQPTAAHLALLDDLKGAIAKHPHLTASEMLAITSQLVGNLIALQDQTKVTADMAMELVCRNIESGNMATLAQLSETRGDA